MQINRDISSYSPEVQQEVQDLLEELATCIDCQPIDSSEAQTIVSLHQTERIHMMVKIIEEYTGVKL